MTRPGQGYLPLSEGSMFGGTDGKRFQVQNEAGRGGQAVVFRVLDTRLSRSLALKLCVAPDGAARRLFMERFERELKLTSRLNHPHVLQLYDCGELPGGFPYVMLEWMEHGSMSGIVEVLRSQGRNLPMAYAAYYGRALAAALYAVHAADVVHRDVKPDNVLIGRDGVAKLTDFGIAKDLSPGAPLLTEMGLTMGTPGFMAPEQLGGLPGPVSDVFSFGVTLYVLLTGQLPDQEISPNRIPLGILKHEAFAILPPAAEAMIRKLTAFEIEERPQTFKEVLALLDTADWSEVDRPVPGRKELPPLPSGVFVSGSTSVMEVETLVATDGGGVAVVTGAPTVDRGGAAELGPGTIGFEDTMDLTVGEVQAQAPGPAAQEPGPTRPFPSAAAKPAKAARPAPAPGEAPGSPEVGPTRPMTVKKRRRRPGPGSDPRPRGKSPLIPALVGLGLVAVVVVVLALVLSPGPPPDDAELLALYSDIESAAQAGDWDAASGIVDGLPETVLERDAGKLVVALDAYLAGDLVGTRGRAEGLVGAEGRVGYHASMLLGACARLDGEGDYDGAANAYAAAASSAGKERPEIQILATYALTQACMLSEVEACAGAKSLAVAGWPRSPRDRALAGSLVLLMDGHPRRAAAGLEDALALPLAADPTCAEVEALRAWGPAAEGLDSSLRGTLAEAARRAARAPADCALFVEGP